MKKYLLLFLFGILLCGCSKTYHSDVKINNGYCSKNGKPYSGEVWSNDGKTMCTSVKDGICLEVKIFHENGRLAVVTQEDPKIKSKYFDENGSEISEQSFMEQYPRFLRKIIIIGESEIQH